MLEWTTVQAEIVRRIIALDTQNQSPRLGHDETQYLRGQIAALRNFANWNPDAPTAEHAVEPELHYGLPEPGADSFGLFPEPEPTEASP